jgi:Calcium binding
VTELAIVALAVHERCTLVCCARSTSEVGSEAKSPARFSKARIEEMLEEATVDANDESEQIMGWFTMIDENLVLPFETTVLGVTVSVVRIDLNRREQIVAICSRGRDRSRSRSSTCRYQRQRLTARNGSKPIAIGEDPGDERVQYYEFQAIDRRLTGKEMAELRACSTRVSGGGPSIRGARGRGRSASKCRRRCCWRLRSQGRPRSTRTSLVCS